ncbi:unnamed protein product [Cylindrotheca closterium]|uniref:Mechanosensitive ion channel protein n=1 Tax=Cylindrotheca closterium TaxID=2856 RepID=A0AAD2CBC0_9STRA|nr:unnamed protein product [Cylindrotheca closterium]
MDLSEDDEAPSDRNSFLDSLRNSDPGFKATNDAEEEITFQEQNAETVRATNKTNMSNSGSDLLALFQRPQEETTPTTAHKSVSPPGARHPPDPFQGNDNSIQSPAPRRSSLLKGPNKPQAIATRGRTVSFDRRSLPKPGFDGPRNRSDDSSSRSPVPPPTSTNLPGVDLPGVDLPGVDLPGVGLPGVDLSGVDVNPRDLWQQQKLQSERALQSERTLTIDDLLSSGPYELEAETNILRAFEEHQHTQPAHQRMTSEMSSSVMSGVPEYLAHDFSIDDENTSDSKKTDEEEKTHSTDDDLERSQRIPLVRSHQRIKSVADQLVGLTLAMQTLQEEDYTQTADDEASLRDGVVSSPTGSQSNHSTRTRDRLNSLEAGLEVLTEVNEDSHHSNSDPQLPRPRFSRFHSNKKSHRTKRVLQGAKDIVEENEVIWKTFIRTRMSSMRTYVKNVSILLLVLTAIAAILYYFAGNPVAMEGQASVSWYLLFCARQVITLSLALASQVIIIDFLCVSTKFLLRLMGQYLTLLLIMSKGWPFVTFMWSLYNFAMLYGNRPFSKHWGFFLSIGLVNESNPSGDVVQSVWNGKVLFIALFLSIATTLKRFIVGLYLGRQTFGHYGPKLATVMQKMLVVSKVGYLAKKLEKAAALRPANPTESMRAKYADKFAAFRPNDSDTDDFSNGASERTLDMNKTDPLTGRLDNLEKQKLMGLLEQWEEPRRESTQSTTSSIAEVLRFRKALTFIQDDYPFAFAFGLADTRDATIRSAQQVYMGLLTATTLSDVVQFETIAEIATRPDGSIDERKAKEAIRVFRPDREGNLTLIDFIKSVDSIYKEFRLLQASIQNSSQIDQTFESIFNIAFYGASITIILSQVGVDPLALFLSFSSIIFAFAFMISSASSKYFEGLLFILVRRPYGIGDIIHISDVQRDTSADGSIGWIVRNVTLTHTLATWVPTLEHANFSNASLSNSRIINWARSPNAKFNIALNFPISTKYETIEIFKRAVEEYMKVRPREWLALHGFRVRSIFAEKGYMEIMISVVHRESWQNCGQVLDSKANLVTYCHEVQKKLGMRYIAPTVPIELIDSRGQDILSLIDNPTTESSSIDSKEGEDQVGQLSDDEMQFQQFRSMAKQKYNIRVC